MAREAREVAREASKAAVEATRTAVEATKPAREAGKKSLLKVISLSFLKNYVSISVPSRPHFKGAVPCCIQTQQNALHPF